MLAEGFSYDGKSPEVFADEEAIETLHRATQPILGRDCVQKYSLTKKRLRRRASLPDCRNSLLCPEVFADEEAIETLPYRLLPVSVPC